MMIHPVIPNRRSARELQKTLRAYTHWADLWRVTFSRDKSNIVWFSNKHFPPDRPAYTLQGFEMEVLEEYPYPGVIFNQHMRWGAQIQKVVSTIRQTRWKICRLMESEATPSIRTCRHLLTAVLIPQIAYTLPFVGYTSKQVQKLETEMLAKTRRYLPLPHSTA